MAKTEITNMIMIQDPFTEEVLVQQRIKYWCGITFPGGHTENGESIYDSAIREAKEETGLTVKNLKYCGMMHWHNNETEEGKVFFTSIESLKNMKLSPNFEKYLPMFLNDDHNEIYCEWNEKMKSDSDGEPDWLFQYR